MPTSADAIIIPYAAREIWKRNAALLFPAIVAFGVIALDGAQWAGVVLLGLAVMLPLFGPSFRRFGASKVVLDDEGIRYDVGGVKLVLIRWNDIELVCPTPFTPPSERSDVEWRLERELKFELKSLWLHVRLRAPDEFRTREGRGHAREIDIHDIALDAIPVPLEELYAFLRARCRVELVAFDWPG